MLAQRKYRFGEFTLDLRRGALFRGAEEVRLRPKSFGVLQALVERYGELVTKEELLEQVWGRTVVTDGAVTQCLIDVRRALGDDAQEIIRTVPRRGYLLTLPVTTADDEPAMDQAPPVIAEPQPAEQSAQQSAQQPDSGSQLEQALRTPSMAPVRDTSWWASRPRRAVTLAALLLALGALAWWGAAARLQQASPATTVSSAAAVTHKSIAVLPFTNLTGATDGEYIGDGLAEEILHLLAQGEGLRVIARTSSFAFKGQPTSIQQIAERLRVDYVVEGSVRQEGTNLRVTAQLIEAASSSHVWSKAYERDVRDLLVVQQDIAQHIATALQTTLRDDLPRATGQAANPAAYDAFLRARFFFNRRLPGDLEQAEHAYKEALRLDPRFARAWAGLAGVYGVSVGEKGVDVPALLQKEQEAVAAAIALDPDLPEARMRAARHYFNVGDLARAAEEGSIGRKLAPDDPLVLAGAVDDLAMQGRMDEAIAVQRRIVAADPVSRVARGNLASNLLVAGRLDEARAEFLNVLAMGTRPDPDTAVDLARVDLFAQRYAEAQAAAEQWPDGPDRDLVLAVAGEGLRKPDVARPAEARLLARTGPVPALRLAELYAHRKDADLAFRWMNLAYDRLGPDPWLSDQWQWVYQLSMSPFLIPLRSDARWAPTAKRGEPRARTP